MTRFRRRLLIALVVLLVLLAGAFGVLSRDWRHEGSYQPTLVASGSVFGAWRVGVGKASLVPPFPAPVSGFNTRGSKPFHDVQSPLDARALVVEVGGRRVALMSVETVALPATIRQQVIAATADLGVDELFVGATHAHSGVGGYWNKAIAEWVGLGPYDPKVEKFFVDQLVAALRQAVTSAKPAQLIVAEKEASGFSVNRNDANGAVDGRLTFARFDGMDGKTIGSLIVFAAHPTTINRVDMALSGDWPGALMRAVESQTGGTALFLQGALGDATWDKKWGPDTGQATANRLGEALAKEVQTTLEHPTQILSPTGVVFWSRVRIGLPKCDISALVPPWLALPASNAFCWAAQPHDIEVSFLQIGGLKLAMLPGEPVARLGQQWREELSGAVIVGLVDDYVGYIETREVMATNGGETKRTYFGPLLAGRILDALRLARQKALNLP